MSDNSIPFRMSLVPFKMLPQCWSSEGVSLSKYMHGPFRRDSLGLHKPSVSFSLNPHLFLQPKVMETSLPSNGLGGPEWGWNPALFRGTSAAEISFPIFTCHMWVWDQIILYLCPSCQSWCGFFFNSLVAGLPLSQISGGSEWWLFCSLVVILIWL